MKNKGDWLLLLAAFIGGGGFISLKYLLDWGYDPYQVIFGRFLMASICMCAVYHKRLRKITKKEWKVGSILGALYLCPKYSGSKEAKYRTIDLESVFFTVFTNAHQNMNEEGTEVRKNLPPKILCGREGYVYPHFSNPCLL